MLFVYIFLCLFINLLNCCFLDEFEFFSPSSRFYNQDDFNDEYNDSNDEEDIDY